MMVPKQLPGVVTSLTRSWRSFVLPVRRADRTACPPISDEGPNHAIQNRVGHPPAFKSGADDKPLFHDYRDVGVELPTTLRNKAW